MKNPNQKQLKIRPNHTSTRWSKEIELCYWAQKPWTNEQLLDSMLVPRSLAKLTIEARNIMQSKENER